MATRPCFISTPSGRDAFKEINVAFTFFPGFSLAQKQKSITSLHDSICHNHNLNVLEISTKSPDPTGVALSAFNLHFFDKSRNQFYAIENIFQSSKVFENGGPFLDLLGKNPKEAKKDERLRTSGHLVKFLFQDKDWPLKPKTIFYDWIYMCALRENKDLSRKILEYNAFTDIEFNPQKSVNCQARAAAIFVSLSCNGQLDKALESKEILTKLYPVAFDAYKQESFF